MNEHIRVQVLSPKEVVMLKQIRCTALVVAGVAGSFLIADGAFAQLGMSGGTSSTGSFGTRTLGGTSTSANRTGRSAGASNSATGQGATGQAAAGAGALSAGAPTGERYVRGNQKGNFVGADTGDGATNSYSGMAGGAGGAAGNMGNMMQAFRQQNQQNKGAQNQQQNKLKVRTPFRVDYMVQPSLTTTFTSRMQTRYSNLPALKGKGSIEPVLEGDTLVLRGSVESAAARQLAEDLLSLEPGVNQVRNELEIVQPGSAPSPVSVGAPEYAEPSAPTRVSRPLER